MSVGQISFRRNVPQLNFRVFYGRQFPEKTLHIKKDKVILYNVFYHSKQCRSKDGKKLRPERSREYIHVAERDREDVCLYLYMCVCVCARVCVIGYGKHFKRHLPKYLWNLFCFLLLRQFTHCNKIFTRLKKSSEAREIILHKLTKTNISQRLNVYLSLFTWLRRKKKRHF